MKILKYPVLVEDIEKRHTLHKTRHNLTPRLQQRMPNHNLQEALQAFPPVLNHVVRESVGKDLARQRWNGDARRLALENVAKVFKVGVAAADGGRLQLKGGDVGAGEDFIVGVHVSAEAVGLGVSDLWMTFELVFCGI